MKLQVQRGRLGRPQKVVFYGPEKIGKSTLASEFPAPLFLDTEHGTELLDVARVPISSAEDFDTALKSIASNDPALAEFKTIVVDTFDWLEQKKADQLCREFKEDSIESNNKGSAFSYGKGIVKLGERMTSVMSMLQKISETRNVVLLSHSTVRKIDLPDSSGSYDRYELDLNQKHVAPLLKHWADAIIFVNYKVAVRESEGAYGRTERRAVAVRERLAFCNHAPFADAGNRHGLPDQLPVQTPDQRRDLVKRLLGASSGGVAPSVPTAGVATEPAASEGGVSAPEAAAATAAPPPEEPDVIPGLEPWRGEFVRLLTPHQDAAVAFLIKRGEITEGQGLVDVKEAYAQRVLRNPAAFLKAAGVVVMQEKEAA